jgi:enoyl-CoA hydratase/carnithine racemase
VADQLVLLECRDKTAFVTLNRPSQYNCLSEEMIETLHGVLDKVAADASIRALVLGGNGRGFCAGHDLKQMRAMPNLAYYQTLFEACSRLMVRVQTMPQPVIARVHGQATAAGCQLVAACDLAIAAADARFAVSGINVGLFCATPSVPLSRNIGRKAAFEMLVTGEFIDTNAAMRYGLINRFVPPELLDEEIAKLLKVIVSKPASAVSMGKALFYRQLEMTTEEAYRLAGEIMATNLMDKAAQEGVGAFLEKRPPKWD